MVFEINAGALVGVEGVQVYCDARGRRVTHCLVLQESPPQPFQIRLLKLETGSKKPLE